MGMYFLTELLLNGCECHQSKALRALDSLRHLALVIRGEASQTTREDTSTLAHKLREHSNVLIVDRPARIFRKGVKLPTTLEELHPLDRRKGLELTTTLTAGL